MHIYIYKHTYSYIPFQLDAPTAFYVSVFYIAENVPKEPCNDFICCDPAGPSHKSTGKRSASCEAQFH